MSFQSFQILADPSVQMLFARGLATTIELFLGAALAAYAIGAILLACRLSSRIGAFAVVAFVEYHRNVPAIVQILIWYFGVPQTLPEHAQAWANLHLSSFYFAVMALALNAAAYISEDLRSGFRAVSPGQLEAAKALGFNQLQAMRLILMPQAVRNALPALVNQALSLLKTTSLAMAIGVGDLMYVARQIDGETYATFAAYLTPTVIYLICTLSLMSIGHHLQKSKHRATRGAP